MSTQSAIRDGCLFSYLLISGSNGTADQSGDAGGKSLVEKKESRKKFH
jgi:hypothetical protein